MTTQNYPTQVLKRSFILHKVPRIDLQNNVQFKQAMDSIFRNPQTYFSNHFNEREVVVGKKTDILPIHNCLSGSFSVPNKQLCRQNNYQSLISQGKTARRTNSNKNLLLNTSSRSNKQNVSNSKELPANQRFIDDIELKKMFEDFRTLQKKNIKLNKSSSAHNILVDNAKSSLKTTMEHILNSQENSLTLYKKITQQSKRLIDKLSKKLNKKNQFYNIGSKDLMAIRFIPDLIDLNVASLKIEGRMKSTYYLATVVGCYRKIIDLYYENGTIKEEEFIWFEREIAKAENRLTSTGFYNGIPTINEQLYDTRCEQPTQEYIGYVLDYKDGIATIEQRNYFCVGDLVEAFGPNIDNTRFVIEKLIDVETNTEETVARHPLQKFYINCPVKLSKHDMLRKVK